MQLDFFAKFAVFRKLKLSFAFGVHVYLVPVGNIILVFTDRTD